MTPEETSIKRWERTGALSLRPWPAAAQSPAHKEKTMNRFSMIALAAGLTGLASAAMAQQTNQPPPPPGPYQAGPSGPGYGQQPAPQGQAQAEAPRAGSAAAQPPGWGAPPPPPPPGYGYGAPNGYGYPPPAYDSIRFRRERRERCGDLLLHPQMRGPTTR